MSLLCAAAAAAPAGKCACMGCGKTFRRLWGVSVPFSLSAPLLCQTIVAIFCGKFEQFANKRPAQEKSLCFSMIETVKRNGLDPFGYLLFLLQELPKLGESPTEGQLEHLFPWSDTISAYCRLAFEVPFLDMTRA